MDASGRLQFSVYGTDWYQAYHAELYAFERLAPIPRSYVVYAAEYIQDDALAIRRLLDESFDLRNTAVTADQLDLPATSSIPATRAEIVVYEHTRVTVKASPTERGLLVLGDHFHPGWQVTVDGLPATLHRVNHVYRGVILPPGEHEITFRFAPDSLRTGAYLSLSGILALAMLLVLGKRPQIMRWFGDHLS